MTKEERKRRLRVKIKLTESDINRETETLAANKIKLDEAQKELAELENKGYFDLDHMEIYWHLIVCCDGHEVRSSRFTNDNIDKSRIKSGNFYCTEEECQRACDMINYQLLVRRKALEMDGFLGYCNDEHKSNILYPHDFGIDHSDIILVSQRQPMVPLITPKCGEILKNDEELNKSAEKAWGYRE